MRGQPQASPARSGAAGSPRRAIATPPGPGDARRRDVARPLPDPVAIRLCQVPDTAPPYDDEGPAESGPARADVLAAAITAALDEGGRGRATTGGQAGTAGQAGVRRRAGTASAAPGGWPSKFAQVLAETLAGSRPPAQLRPWTTERARSHIRRLGPMLTAGQQPLVHRIVTSVPAAGVIEMSVVVGFGPRVRALAVRLERTEPRPGAAGQPAGQQRWLCTAVEAA
jgi:hypothetical protein